MKTQQTLEYGLILSLWLGLPMLAGCGAQGDGASEPKVTNGRVISSEHHPEVVMLSMKTSEGIPAICTGTFITPTAVLTAAHCVTGGPANANGKVEMDVVIQGDDSSHDTPVVARSTDVYRHPAWSDNEGVSPVDLALIFFSPGHARGVARIANSAPESGDAIVIVGYGINAINRPRSSGVKRMGTNTLDDITEEGFLHFSGAPYTTDASGEDSASGSGDSGGPMFNSRGHLVGVTSGGFAESDSKHSLYVDLNSASSRRFLSAYLPD